MTDTTDYNSLAAAAQSGKLDHFNLTSGALRMADKTGWTVAHLAASCGHLDQIPPELFTIELLCISDETGQTVAHEAAMYGHLDQIPSGLFTIELLCISDETGWTVAHEAAMYGHLDQIPKEMLTAELLRVADKDGATIAHEAAKRNGQLSNLLNCASTERLLELLSIDRRAGHTDVVYPA